MWIHGRISGTNCRYTLPRSFIIKELKPEMIGIGPFIPHKDTPFAKELPGTLEQTSAIIVNYPPDPPTRASSGNNSPWNYRPQGQREGNFGRANVVMPNLSPVNVRDKYTLYDNKICTGDEAAECKACMAARMKSIGYEVVTDRGDYKA